MFYLVIKEKEGFKYHKSRFQKNEDYNTFVQDYSISNLMTELIEHEEVRLKFTETKQKYKVEQDIWKDKEEENAKSIFLNILRRTIALEKQKALFL